MVVRGARGRSTQFSWHLDEMANSESQSLSTEECKNLKQTGFSRPSATGYLFMSALGSLLL